MWGFLENSNKSSFDKDDYNINKIVSHISDKLTNNSSKKN